MRLIRTEPKNPIEEAHPNVRMMQFEYEGRYDTYLITLDFVEGEVTVFANGEEFPAPEAVSYFNSEPQMIKVVEKMSDIASLVQLGRLRLV